jgi:hypothetical protein
MDRQQSPPRVLNDHFDETGRRNRIYYHGPPRDQVARRETSGADISDDDDERRERRDRSPSPDDEPEPGRVNTVWLAEKPTQDRFKTYSRREVEDIPRGQIFEVLAFELAVSKNSMCLLETRFCDVCGKLRFGVNMGYNRITRRMRGIFFGTSGSADPQG